ncbi:hypothetical protein BN938_1440 [Mucinivorans hirudinis]|uniref:DUF4276 family protein n=1 Tax=Mucinivorans hirudinis TaxID=1433126 RepID=A0A060R845_9BACT|nr:hypothetical protein BN938_1440 [Mucinivorans hirudinis]
MKLYFLVEGSRTEMKIYPSWLGYILPGLNRKNHPKHLVDSDYYMVSGNGMPNLLNEIEGAIEDVREYGIDYLVLILDAENESVANQIELINSHLAKENISIPDGCTLKIVVQNRCIETWLLANRRIFKSNPQSETLNDYIHHYNVSENDPEAMPLCAKFKQHAHFHLNYLKLIFEERNTNYSKTNPQGAREQHFFDQLVERNRQSGDIESFGSFIDFCNEIKKRL